MRTAKNIVRPGSVLLALGLAIAISPRGADADDRRNDHTRLVIMTCNAEFLWDGIAPEEGSSEVVFPWKGDPVAAKQHMEAIAEVIRDADPDIINLVEVENIDALTRFNDEHLAGRGYKPFLINGDDTFTGQDVALLTRIDPEGGAIERDGRRFISGAANQGVSKNYFARFTVDGLRFAMIGLHFLAQPDRLDRKDKREAQAGVLTRLAGELRAEGRELIVLGDFNDYDGAPDARDHIDSIPITKVLSGLRAQGTGPDDDLVNAASIAPQSLRFTAFFDRDDDGNVDLPGEVTSIDHILLSKPLAARATSVAFLHDHDPRTVSDHFPILVQLTTTTPPPGGPTPPSPIPSPIPPAPMPTPAVASVKIVSLLPNPASDETRDEAVTIRNGTGSVLDLTGWTLRDRAGQTWALSGTLGLGAEATVTRNGQAMALNNNGDRVELRDPIGVLKDSVTYTRAFEGEVIFAP